MIFLLNYVLLINLIITKLSITVLENQNFETEIRSRALGVGVVSGILFFIIVVTTKVYKSSKFAWGHVLFITSLLTYFQCLSLNVCFYFLGEQLCGLILNSVLIILFRTKYMIDLCKYEYFLF